MPNSDKQANSGEREPNTQDLSEGDLSGTSRAGESRFDSEPPPPVAPLTIRSGGPKLDTEPAERLPPIERVRFRIAVGVLCGFFGLISVPTIAFLVAMFVTESVFGVDDFVRVVTTLSAATAGLAGAVVGYYFGQNSNA